MVSVKVSQDKRALKHKNALKRSVASPLSVDIRDVTLTFSTPSDSTYTALQHLSLSVKPAEFCAIVGPTGCGKSTALSLVAGMTAPSSGEVRVGDRRVEGINTDVGLVFQNDTVLPWKRVLANVACGPEFRGMGKQEARALGEDWLRRVGLDGFGDRYMHQLSGGMRRRVAFAQSLINEPRVLLMDEPFSALDVQTRIVMSDELLALWEQTKPTVIFVTHDLEEAISLADRVVVLTAGPASVKAEFAIDLPRPRRVHELRFQQEFRELYAKIWEALRDEVMLTYARETQSGRGSTGVQND